MNIHIAEYHGTQNIFFYQECNIMCWCRKSKYVVISLKTQQESIVYRPWPVDVYPTYLLVFLAVTLL